MNLKMVKKGVQNPSAVPSYLYRRFRDYRSKNRITFDRDTITGSVEYPEFSKELFSDVELLEKSVESALSRKQVNNSLEIGCGFGRLTPWISRYSQQHHAIEAEQDLIEDAENFYPNVQFNHTLAQEIPYGDSEFGLIVTWAVLMHIPDDQIEDACSEIQRVNGESGKVIVSEKIGETTDVSRVFTRTVSEYENLFSPMELSATIKRDMDEEYWDEDHRHMLMIFE